MAEWLPPHERPWNEAGGYLGYYTRTYLPEVFDLVDCDGGWPAAWLYYQANGRTFRIIEEKPHGQKLHPSQNRTFTALGAILALGIKTGAFSERSGVYIIYDAERLVAPEFPISMEKCAPSRTPIRSLDREEFDAWLLLREAPTAGALAETEVAA